MAENLDDLLAVHHFLYIAFRPRNVNLLAQEQAGGMAADVAGQQRHDHNAAYYNQRQPDAVIHHDAENAEEGDGGDGHLRKALADHLTQRIDIVGVITHDIAVAVRIKITDGQILHMVKHLFTKLGQRTLGDNGHQLCIADSCDQADDIHDNQDRQQFYNLSGSRRPVSGCIVVFHNGNGVLHEDGRYGADNRVNQDTAQGQRQKHRVKLKYGADETLHHALGGALASSGGGSTHCCHLLLGSEM